MSHRPFRTACLVLLLLVLFGSTATAQQRTDFQRQKFDRGRFGGPAPAPPPPAPAAVPVAPVAPVAPPQPGGNTWVSPATGGTSPMATEFPAAPAAGGAGFPAAAPAAGAFDTFGSIYPANATPEEKAAIDSPLFDQVPNKWFNNAKDYPEALALQKKTGACLLIYFQNPGESDEKGLCSWFEKSTTTDLAWRKAMRYFIKMEIIMPGPSATRELVAQYHVNKTPALFVLKPGSTRPVRLVVFEYPAGSRPKPIEVPVVLDSLRGLCTPAYSKLF